MARKRRREEIEMGMDSFVDIIANTVGILVLLVIVAMQGLEEGLISLSDVAKNLHKNVVLNEELKKKYQDLVKSMSKEDLEKMSKVGDLQKELVQVRERNKRLSSEVNDAMRLAVDAKHEADTAAARAKQAAKDVKDTQFRLADTVRRKKELEQEIQTWTVKVPKNLMAAIQGGMKPEELVTKLNNTAFAKRDAIKKIEENLSRLAVERKRLTDNSYTVQLEKLKARLKARNAESARLSAEIKKLQAMLDDYRERTEQVAMVTPRRDIRVKKRNRIVFECTDGGVQFLYSTDGRHVKINDKAYSFSGKRSFPITVKRLSDGESAVMLWKSQKGDAPKSEFEKRLSQLKPSEYDLIFIVRAGEESYRNFRRARYIAEDQLKYACQWELMPASDTLVLRRPKRSRRTVGNVLAASADSGTGISMNDPLVVPSSGNSDANLLVESAELFASAD